MPNSLVATHTYRPDRLILVGEMVRLLVSEIAVLVSVIATLSSAVMGLWFPSLSCNITQETVGRGNPSTEQLNTAASGANTARSIGGVVMMGEPVSLR